KREVNIGHFLHRGKRAEFRTFHQLANDLLGLGDYRMLALHWLRPGDRLELREPDRAGLRDHGEHGKLVKPGYIALLLQASARLAAFGCFRTRFSTAHHVLRRVPLQSWKAL